MRILLIGDDSKCMDVAHDAGQLSVRCNAELLADFRFCVFDRQEVINPQDGAAEFRQELNGSEAAAIIFPYGGAECLHTLRGMPARLQSLVPMLSSGGAVAVPTDKLAEILPFQDTVDPVQDALIRLIVAHPDTSISFSERNLASGSTAPSLPELAPGMSAGATTQMQEHLSRFAPEELAPVDSAADAVALVAGLFLMHDCLDRSHSLSQDVQGQGRHVAGDYWHAIMHRREPDYGNSKYWYRRVGHHPVFHDLAQRAAKELASLDGAEARAWSDRICGTGDFNAFTWVDFCAEAADGNSGLYGVAQRIQWHEMLLLLRQTADDAFGTR